MTGLRFRQRLPLDYLLLLCFLSFGYLLAWPIMKTDTDIWYHLCGGRYLYEHHALPQTTYFSFISSPARPWVDYYWWFQAAAYQLYSWFGYYGLIALRALLHKATGKWRNAHNRMETGGPLTQTGSVVSAQ